MPDRAAKTVAYQRRLKRTSRMGEKNTNQKPGVLASAAMAAIFGSGTFAPAISWGITKKIIPLASPMVASERPNNHTGGTGRVTFSQASESCSYYYGSSRLRRHSSARAALGPHCWQAGRTSAQLGEIPRNSLRWRNWGAEPSVGSVEDVAFLTAAFSDADAVCLVLQELHGQRDISMNEATCILGNALASLLATSRCQARFLRERFWSWACRGRPRS